MERSVANSAIIIPRRLGYCCKDFIANYVSMIVIIWVEMGGQEERRNSWVIIVPSSTLLSLYSSTVSTLILGYWYCTRVPWYSSTVSVSR